MGGARWVVYEAVVGGVIDARRELGAEGAEGVDVGGGCPSVLAAENREHRTRLVARQGVERIAARRLPRSGRPHHAVEGHPLVEAPGAGGAKRVHAAHAESEHANARDTS